MTDLPTPTELKQLGDLELRSLGAGWRLLDGFGHPDAADVLAVLAAEWERRLTASRSEGPTTPPTTWWPED